MNDVIKPSLWTDERGFAHYGRMRLPFRIVSGILEFKVSRTDHKREYGPCILVEVEELASLCNCHATELDLKGEPMIK